MPSVQKLYQVSTLVKHCRVFFIALVMSISSSITGSDTLCLAKSISFLNLQTQDTLKVRTLLSDAQDLLYKGDINLAIQNITAARALSDSLNYEYGIALTEVRRADILIYAQKIDSAISILNNVIANFPNSRARPHFYNQLAAAYSYKGQPIQSIENYTKALDFVYLMTDDRQDHTKAAILVNMASAYQKLGDKSNTFSNYLEGLRFAESSKDTIFTVITLNNLGDAYNSYEEFEKADYYLNKSLDLATEKDYKSELLRIYLNLGNTKTNLEEFDQALEFYERALNLNKIVRPNTPPFQITYNLGNLYLRKMNFRKAKQYFEESLGYCETLNIPQGSYYNYSGLGDLYEKFSQPYKAIEWYTKALEVATKLNLNQFVIELNEKLYSSNKQTGNTVKALFHLEKFKALSDSILKVESENTLSELESKIELDRQTQINRLLEEKQTEQERLLQLRERLNISAVFVIIIILLFLFFIFKSGRERKKINHLLNQQKEELEQLNQTKDKLFAIVAHDLRSPMASMQGILYLINSSDLSPKEIKALAVDLEPTLQKNVDTLDDLLVWARKQMSGISINLESTDAFPIIEDVISKQIFQLEAKRIKVESFVKEQTFVFVDVNAFRLIIRNLLANSIKFTEADGSIIFNSTYEDDHVIFSVKDTGIGIPEELQGNIFADNGATRKGTNMELGTGFGLSLCKEFVLRMNGDIYFESSEGEGTTFFVKLPKNST